MDLPEEAENRLRIAEWVLPLIAIGFVFVPVFYEHFLAARYGMPTIPSFPLGIRYFVNDPPQLVDNVLLVGLLTFVHSTFRPNEEPVPVFRQIVVLLVGMAAAVGVGLLYRHQLGPLLYVPLYTLKEPDLGYQDSPIRALRGAIGFAIVDLAVRGVILGSLARRLGHWSNAVLAVAVLETAAVFAGDWRTTQTIFVFSLLASGSWVLTRNRWVPMLISAALGAVITFGGAPR